ncbi:MAG: CheR family methyltransferase [Pseudomonadota bacterium]
MGKSISPILLSRLSEFMAEQMGLHFPRERWPDLERGICAAAREFNFDDMESCLQWLTSSHLQKSQVEILASHLTVGETYFFREKRTFGILEGHIFPELIRVRRETEKRLRLWSAGCATGEESYSLAILLNKLLPDLKDWNITILATDINPRFLQKASKGLYGNWSFRDTPLEIQERYFKRKKGGGFELLPEIKKMVTFSYLNLAEDTYPSLLNNTNAIDLIFCRNVLMYFAPHRAKNVILNLYRALVDGGWLVVSSAEASHVLFSQFETVNFSGGIMYRKTESCKLKVASFALPAFFSDFIPETLNPEPTIAKQEVSAALLQDSPEPFPLEVEEPKESELQSVRYEEALTLYQQGRYAEAAEKLLVLLFPAQQSSKVSSLLARVYADQGNLTDALKWCEEAILTDRLNVGLYYLRAIILQEQGLEKEAITSLKRALYLDQNFVVAHFSLGTLAQQQGKLNQADKYFTNALSLLRSYEQEEILPESEGITAGRLKEIISGIRGQVPGISV